MKTKGQTKLSVPDRTCMFSLQEYQHVHLLCFKKRSFTLVWKPNPPLRAPSRSCWRAEWKHNGRALLPLCIRAASALPLLCYACGVKPGSTEALARDQWNLSPATMCCGWQRARFGAGRPCTSTSATTANFYSHTLKKWSHFGRSLEPWIYEIIL